MKDRDAEKMAILFEGVKQEDILTEGLFDRIGMKTRAFGAKATGRLGQAWNALQGKSTDRGKVEKKVDASYLKKLVDIIEDLEIIYKSNAPFNDLSLGVSYPHVANALDTLRVALKKYKLYPSENAIARKEKENASQQAKTTQPVQGNEQNQQTPANGNLSQGAIQGEENPITA